MSKQRKGFIYATFENEADETSTDYRLHYFYLKGSPAVMYQRNGDPGWPEDAPEIEFDFAERIVDGKPVPEYDPIVLTWAEKYLNDALDQIAQQEYEAEMDAAEYAAEIRSGR